MLEHLFVLRAGVLGADGNACATAARHLVAVDARRRADSSYDRNASTAPSTSTRRSGDAFALGL